LEWQTFFEQLPLLNGIALFCFFSLICVWSAIIGPFGKTTSIPLDGMLQGGRLLTHDFRLRGYFFLPTALFLLLLSNSGEGRYINDDPVFYRNSIFIVLGWMW